MSEYSILVQKNPWFKDLVFSIWFFVYFKSVWRSKTTKLKTQMSLKNVWLVEGTQAVNCVKTQGLFTDSVD